LKIIYTMRIDDPTKYFAQFTTALSVRLASELCFTLSESTSKTKDLYEEYEKIRLPRAIAIDSQQSTPQAIIQDEWETARIDSGGDLIGMPGYETWHPHW